MTSSPVLGRRAMLAGACLTCVGAVAGCSSSSGSDSGSAPAQPAGSAPAAAPSAAASSSASGSASASASSGSKGLVALADVPVGSGVVVDGSDGPLVVAQPQAGTVVAYSAICTHQGVVVGVDGDQAACPAHGSRFRLSDGSVARGPAPKPLPKASVAVQGDQVVLA
ncbi:nitrite reductase/ring-hydroxylating ferredoxin subunit [Motilibacter peucedani]|uniref:Cytochrome bc1 complex Rieske iron-sulfur subunit n=1 Tax=Motilibacter peucedani TaxID=598650 RepID=A0A420XU14_9ACTN|nr:Rieske (2Fe-2S) protein [Motilibacter peucedani]RKS80318.1 nitrite reductase/ring-hydroxylating ferredoxin subunit [Motilibacter peucedani]